MHVYFSGIGGTGIGPLALIARQAGYEVSGSDAKDSLYLDYLRDKGLINFHIGQSEDEISQVHQIQPIDWFVYSSAIQADHPELVFCQQNNIKTSKRDEFLNKIIDDHDLRLLAIAGTHGKTTTTAMAIWLFKSFNIPISYSVGAKLAFGDMGEFDPSAKYFIYEADEYDRNFLAFHPNRALISGIDWDHPDTYPTREDYYSAFKQFISQSKQTLIWQEDATRLELHPSDTVVVLDPLATSSSDSKLIGNVNRLNASLVALALHEVIGKSLEECIDVLNTFPGLARRFESIAPNLYSDYAHTPPKIRGAIQTAQEVAGPNVVVVYEGIHNLRQHFIKQELANLFDSVKKLYVIPTYLGREDAKLAVLSNQELIDLMSLSTKSHAEAAKLNDQLQASIQNHLSNNDLVLCLSAGGGDSLDEWIREKFAK